jgi:hypothetical protein
MKPPAVSHRGSVTSKSYPTSAKIFIAAATFFSFFARE